MESGCRNCVRTDAATLTPFYIRTASRLLYLATCRLLHSHFSSGKHIFLLYLYLFLFYRRFPACFSGHLQSERKYSSFIYPLPLSRIHSCRHRFGFIRCKGLLPRLIRRLEVHFLQILPFCARVIGRKSRRMKLFRQPYTASIKPQSGSGRKRTEQREKKKQSLTL